MATVLLVEDDDQARVLAESCLEQQGHQVLSAGTEKGAIAILKREGGRMVRGVTQPYRRAYLITRSNQWPFLSANVDVALQQADVSYWTQIGPWIELTH